MKSIAFHMPRNALKDNISNGQNGSFNKYHVNKIKL